MNNTAQQTAFESTISAACAQSLLAVKKPGALTGTQEARDQRRVARSALYLASYRVLGQVSEWYQGRQDTTSPLFGALDSVPHVADEDDAKSAEADYVERGGDLAHQIKTVSPDSEEVRRLLHTVVTADPSLFSDGVKALIGDITA